MMGEVTGYIISDLTQTIVASASYRPVDGLNIYDAALARVNDLMFQGDLNLRIALSTRGRLFPACIAEILANQLPNRHFTPDAIDQLVPAIIDKHLRQQLVRLLQQVKVPLVEGVAVWLGNFRNWQISLVTGDLRAVAYQLVTGNAAGDLREFLPEKLWVCGDDQGIKARIDLLQRAFQLLGQPIIQPLAIIDDSSHGIASARQLADNLHLPNVRIIGVLTGSDRQANLFAAGADIVIDHLGHLTPELITN